MRTVLQDTSLCEFTYITYILERSVDNSEVELVMSLVDRIPYITYLLENWLEISGNDSSTEFIAESGVD